MNRTLLRSFLIMFGLTVVSLLSLGVSFSFVATADRAVEAATDARYRSHLLADELRQSSDDLTRLARTYVVTGDPKYEDQYWEVLDIRNGKKPRPLSYHRIYWDFVAASGIPPRAADTTVSLQALMKHAGFTDEEFAKLRQAQENSDDLVRTETIAMNAMKGRFDDGKGGYTRVGAPDPDLARQLMHDEKYHAFKAKIMRPVDEFYELMEARTTAAVASARDRAWLFKVVFSSMLALTAILLPVTAWLLYRRLVREIGAEPAEAMRIVDRMSANLGIDLRGEPETLSLMARTIRMHDGLLALIRNVNAHTATVSELAGRLKTTAEAAHHTAGEQSFMLQGLAQDAEELSASIAQVSDSGNGAQEISAQSGALAREGATVIQQAVEEIVTIETTVAQGTTSVEALGEQAEQISSIIKVIKDVADQTNLLALNAAIEAARAGEQGRGFAVVADEVRKLAERTTQSAGQITEMIAAIQSSAAASVTSIRQILVQVRSGVELARKGGASIDQIQTSADRVLSVIEDLSETLRSQRVATSEVSRKTETLAAGLDSNVSAVATVNTVAGELQDVASELKHAIARFDQALATRAA